LCSVEELGKFFRRRASFRANLAVGKFDLKTVCTTGPHTMPSAPWGLPTFFEGLLSRRNAFAPGSYPSESSDSSESSVAGLGPTVPALTEVEGPKSGRRLGTIGDWETGGAEGTADLCIVSFAARV
jgi:hypothetical protein